MQTIEYRTHDRSTWGSGRWDNEPDKKQWQDPETGLPCLMKRNRYGAWCGYVGVSKGHPLFEKDYSETYEHNISVHGGLTYAAFCESEADPAHGICHVDENHEPVWWFGFDCLHDGDSAPLRDERGRLVINYGEYQDAMYVTREVTDLAQQLTAVARL